MSRAGGQRGVLDAAQALRGQGRRFALALVTDTEGSTYRKAGALALVSEDGDRVGTLSGGCLEPALDQLGRRALASNAVAREVFDTRADDDLLFGSGSGCRGRMGIQAWPLPGAGDAVLAAALAAEQTGKAQSLRIGVSGTALGEVRVDEGSGGIPEGHVRLVLRASPRLLLLGAGPEAPPLLQFARRLGWHTVVADHRPGLLDADRLSDADQVIAARPGECLAQTRPAPDAVLVMTHLASCDREALQALGALPGIAYVGLLGPPERRDELMASLSGADGSSLQARLRAPVGLPLGGEGPEAIALAIAADLQRFFQAGR